jgi:tyrosyl-tRNA synthetase
MERLVLKEDRNRKLLKRSVAEVIVEEELIELLNAGRSLRLKMGFDPSAPDLHMGHAVGLRKLRQFQEMGHQVVVIVGDWTAQIGDPSGQSVTRPVLTADQVNRNAETYLEQFFKIVDKDRTEVRMQSEWFGNFSLTEVINLTSRFTIAQFLARDDFSKRFESNQPIAITELLYPLLQAYDSVAIKSDVEFGGTDQKFNLLVGRELQGMMGQLSQQLVMVPILPGTDGIRKMSKSLGNYISLDDSPNDMYGKTMSIPDAMISVYFEYLTDISDIDIEEIEGCLNSGTINPMDLKKKLANALVSQFHDFEAAQNAESYFRDIVQRGNLPNEIEEVIIEKDRIKTIGDFQCTQIFRDFGLKIESGVYVSESQEFNVFIGDLAVDITHLVYSIGLASSVREARSLLGQGSISIDGRRINSDHDGQQMVIGLRNGTVIQRGTRKFKKIKLV